MKWRDVKGYGGTHIISENGDIMKLQAYDARGHLRSAKIVKPYKTVCGYMQVHLYASGGRKSFLVHRLVAEAFLDNPYNHSDVNHIDEDKSHNSVSNLEWCSRAYNCRFGNAQAKRLRMREINAIYGLTGKTKKERSELCVQSF